MAKELLFYAAFNGANNPLYMHTISPHEQPTRDEWIKSVETSFLREDVMRIEVWHITGTSGQIYHTETFTLPHPDLRFGTCQCGEACSNRIFMPGRYAHCAKCHRLKCKEHGKFHYKSDTSLCLDCYAIEEGTKS